MVSRDDTDLLARAGLFESELIGPKPPFVLFHPSFQPIIELPSPRLCAAYPQDLDPGGNVNHVLQVEHADPLATSRFAVLPGTPDDLRIVQVGIHTGLVVQKPRPDGIGGTSGVDLVPGHTKGERGEEDGFGERFKGAEVVDRSSIRVEHTVTAVIGAGLVDCKGSEIVTSISE